MFPRIDRRLWRSEKIQIRYENMVGKMHVGRRIRVEDAISAGAKFDLKFPGVQFDADGVVVKIFAEGTIIIYGARSREAMWRSVQPILRTLGVSCGPDGLSIFLVVAKVDLMCETGEFQEEIMRMLGRSYDVCYDQNMAFPGIMIKRGQNTTNCLFARLYTSGIMICEGMSEEAVHDAILEIHGIVMSAKRRHISGRGRAAPTCPEA